MCVVVNVSLVESIQGVKTTLGWGTGPVTEAKMPFSQHMGLVAELLEGLRQELGRLRGTVWGGRADHNVLKL